MKSKMLSVALMASVMAVVNTAGAQAPAAGAPANGAAGANGGRAGRGAGRGGGGGRPAVAPRDPHTEGYVTAKELPDGEIPPADADGNFIIGPSHPRPQAMAVPADQKGDVVRFQMKSTVSKIYPGIGRTGGLGTADPTDPAKMVVNNSGPMPYSRNVQVYVPKQYVPGTEAPFIVTADGDASIFPVLDGLIAAKKVPVMIGIAIASGGSDAQGSQRGLEYDTMSGLYAEFVETEVLPRVVSEVSKSLMKDVKLTKDPEGRATMGGSSGGSAALIMAWYHNDLYHRVLTYSCTAVNQQWPFNPATPYGAWAFTEDLIKNAPVKPIRMWMEVGDKDLLNPNVMKDNMHDWVVANEKLAKILADKGYHYQFVFSKNAVHVDGPTKQQTIAEALEYVWKGYPIK